MCQRPGCFPQPTEGHGAVQNYSHCKEAGVTSGTGFHHSEIMLLALDPERRGGEGGKAEWVAVGLGKVPGLEKEAAGTSGELQRILGGTHHAV